MAGRTSRKGLKDFEVGTTMYRLVWISKSERLAVFARDNVSTQVQEEHHGTHQSYDLVKIYTGKISVVFTQARPNISTEQMESLLEKAMGKCDLLIGDFNAKVPGLLLGRQKATLSGKVIQHECIAFENRILNPIGVPTYTGK